MLGGGYGETLEPDAVQSGSLRVLGLLLFEDARSTLNYR
jgi:hypothetical protein